MPKNDHRFAVVNPAVRHTASGESGLYLPDPTGIKCVKCGYKMSGIVIFPDHHKENWCARCVKNIFGIECKGDETIIEIAVTHFLGEIPINQGELFHTKSVVQPVGGAKFASDRWGTFGRTDRQIDKKRRTGLTAAEKEAAELANDVKIFQDAIWTECAWATGIHEKYSTSMESNLEIVLYDNTWFIFTESGTPLYTIDYQTHKPVYHFSHLN